MTKNSGMHEEEFTKNGKLKAALLFAEKSLVVSDGDPGVSYVNILGRRVSRQYWMSQHSSH